MHGYNGAKTDLEILRKGFMDVENQCSKIRKHRKLIIIFGTIRNSFEKKCTLFNSLTYFNKILRTKE